MADVFISYSRKDSAFARKLEQALRDIGRESWVDWSSIPYSEDWWQEICAGIDGADNFLFVMSPDSLMSMVCNKELAYAREQNKRIIPILHREILSNGKPLSEILTAWYAEDWEQTADDNLSELQRLNWLFFREEDNFGDWFDKLVTTAETNPEHVKNHTRLLLWAREWERQGKNPSNLLKGEDLTNAEAWLRDSDKLPHATDLHRGYIAESRRVEDELAAETARREQLIRRFRLAAGTLFVVGTLAIIAAVGSLAASQEAQSRADAASTQAIDAELREAEAVTQVAIANATLTPIPPTLTQAAILRQDAEDQYQIAFEFTNAVLNNPNSRQVVERMNVLVNLYPENALAYSSRGLAYYNIGEYKEAIADYTQAISIEPQYLEAHNNRGNAYSALQQYEQAIADYTQAISIDPQYPDAYNNRGNAYSKLQQYEAAIADYTQAISIDPQYTLAYNNRGFAHFKAGQYDEAIADYTQAISIDPQDTFAYNNRGNIYWELQQYEKAIADFTQVISIDPQYPDTYNNRGNTYYALGRNEEAIADFTQAIFINPNYAEAYYNRGNVYGALERYEEAIANFTQAIIINPQFAPAYFYRALTYVYINQPENAENDLSHYLSLDGPLSEAERAFFEEAAINIPSD